MRTDVTTGTSGCDRGRYLTTALQISRRPRRAGAAELEAPSSSRSAIPAFHARQIYPLDLERGVTDFAGMTDLAARPCGSHLAASLSAHRHPSHCRARPDPRTAPGSSSSGWPTAASIESVFIPDTPAQTFCISTQVGCAMGCAFCLTGKMGLVRHLTAGEIAGQVRVLACALDMLAHLVQHRPHGHGRAAPQLRRDDEGAADAGRRARAGVSPRRVTLSTVGLVPMLDRLAAEPLMPNLAISLHATTEEQRDGHRAARPRSTRCTTSSRRAAASRSRKRSRITFEYVLLPGVNDTPEDARRLATLLAGSRRRST